MTTTRLDSRELFPLEAALRGLRERFADAVIDADRGSLREHLVVVPAGRLRDVVAAVHGEWGCQLVTAFALDERDPHGRFRIHVLFSTAPEDAILTLVCAVPEDAPHYLSITPVCPAAAWLEREIRDLMGVVPDGHPDPRPLIAHAGWPPDLHPQRRDFRPPQGVDWAPRLAPVTPEIEGVYEIPVGPIHAGIIEAGHFRIAAAGESIVSLDARLGWLYRGLETLAAGQPFSRGLEIAERVCGTCAFSHALAFSQAIEEAAGTLAPPRARALRTLAAELERLYNHAGDLAAILGDIAWRVGAQDAARLKETLQQTIAALFGHRFLRGVCVPGGVVRDLDDAQQLWLRQVLNEVRADVEALAASVMSSAGVLDRLRDSGTLTPRLAHALGAVGPAARASGSGRDTRRDHPYAFYRDLDFTVPEREAGDVLARVEVRFEEIHQSLNLIDQMILRLPGGALNVHLGEIPAGRSGLSLVESPRGRLVHWLRLAGGHTLECWRVRSASHANWPALEAAAPGNIVPDFPLINRSFNLCYACVDR